MTEIWKSHCGDWATKIPVKEEDLHWYEKISEDDFTIITGTPIRKIYSKQKDLLNEQCKECIGSGGHMYYLFEGGIAFSEDVTQTIKYTSGLDRIKEQVELIS